MKKWTTAHGHYPNKVMWWCRHVKHRLRYFFNNRRRQKREEQRKMENHYYKVVYDILRGPKDFQDKAIELRRMKGKIVRLNTAYYQHMMLDSGQQNNYVEEGRTLYYIIRGRKRREHRTVHSLQTEDGQLLVTSRAILHAFHDRYEQQYDKLPREDSHFQVLAQHIKMCIPNYTEAALMTAVTFWELHHVIQHSPRNKSPGTDGIYYEFYRTHCEGIKVDLLVIIN
jgi:hypothetical protein